jgi:hypothetical protein
MNNANGIQDMKNGHALMVGFKTKWNFEINDDK